MKRHIRSHEKKIFVLLAAIAFIIFYSIWWRTIYDDFTHIDAGERIHADRQEKIAHQRIKTDFMTLQGTVPLPITTEELQEVLPGSWRSLEDESYIITFDDYVVSEFYSEKLMEESSYILIPPGEDTAHLLPEDAKEGMHVLIRGDASTRIYRVLSLSRNNIELSFLKNGETLSFVRVSSEE